VQQAGSVLAIEVSNLADHWSLFGALSFAWPVLLALAVWIAGLVAENSLLKRARSPLIWLLLSWAALRSPNGLVPFLLILAACLVLHVLAPALRRIFQLVRQPHPALPPTESGTATAAASLIIAGLAWFSLADATLAHAKDFQ